MTALPIRFVPGMADDAALLSRVEDKLAQAFLKNARVAADPCHMQLADIKPCAGPLSGWYRYKPSIERMYADGCAIRIVYRVENNALVVLAVGDRAHVYGRAAARLRRAYAAWQP